MSQTRQSSADTSTASTPASSAPTFGSAVAFLKSEYKAIGATIGAGATFIYWIYTIQHERALAAKAEAAAEALPAAVKAKAIAEAINMLSTHTEAMEEERKEWHVPRPTAEDPIKSFLNSSSHAYALLHGPQGCGKSEAVLAAVIAKDGSLRKGVLKVKVEGEVGNLASFVCRKLKVAEGDESDLEEVLRGTLV